MDANFPSLTRAERGHFMAMYTNPIFCPCLRTAILLCNILNYLYVTWVNKYIDLFFYLAQTKTCTVCYPT